jgi:hypothetical protein
VNTKKLIVSNGDINGLKDMDAKGRRMRKIRSFEDLAKQVKMAKGRCHVISLEG